MRQEHRSKISNTLASALLGIAVFRYARLFPGNFPLNGFSGVWINLALFTLLNCFGVYSLANLYGFRLKDCRISRPAPGLLGLCVGFGVPAAFIFAMTRLPGPGIWSYRRLPVEYVFQTLLPTAINWGFGSGINEELLFRGFMLKAAEKNYGRKAAVAITSLAFGLGHIIGKSMSPPEACSVFVYTGSMGVLLAVVTLKSGSIWNSVVIHWLTNVCEVVISMGFHPEFKSPIIYTFSLATANLLKERPYLPYFIYTAVVWAVIALLCVLRKRPHCKD